MKLNKWIITRIIISTFSMISVTLNVLYMCNFISEFWIRMGCAVFILCSWLVITVNDKVRIQPKDKISRAVDIVMIVTSAAWAITYVMSIFH